MAGVQEDKVLPDDLRIEQLRGLLESVQASQQNGDMTNVQERLEFDFPSCDSIIVDPKCRCLKGFIGAEWIAQQFIMPLEHANAYFELRGTDQITVGRDFIQYTDEGLEKTTPNTTDPAPPDPSKTPMGCFWEIFDLTTKEHFFICDGWPKYVQAPEPVAPSTNRFWPIFALTFNDIVVVPGQKVHIYPPSDVQILKQIQKESNRMGNELKEHREINRPFFWALKGIISPEDQEKLANHKTGEFIELSRPLSGPNGQDMPAENAMGVWEGAPIDRNMYDRTPLQQDMGVVIGSNQVVSQGQIRHVAATPAVIQEQARMSGVSSNVDDLDDLLSELAEAGGEMILRVFSPQTIMRIVGPGASMPDMDREDYLNSVYLTIVAASSGRPNKAVDIQNAMQLGPLMIQAGANPWGLIQYFAKVLDANLDPTEFAPVSPVAPNPPTPAGGGASKSGPSFQQPLSHNQQPGRAGNQPGGMGFPAGVQQGGQH